MISKSCPACNRRMTARYIITNIKKDAIYCPYCGSRLVPKLRSVMLNSLILGGTLGAILAIFTSLSMELIILITTFLSVFFQKYIDLFFQLKVEEDDFF